MATINPTFPTTIPDAEIIDLITTLQWYGNYVHHTMLATERADHESLSLLVNARGTRARDVPRRFERILRSPSP